MELSISARSHIGFGERADSSTFVRLNSIPLEPDLADSIVPRETRVLPPTPSTTVRSAPRSLGLVRTSSQEM